MWLGAAGEKQLGPAGAARARCLLVPVTGRRPRGTSMHVQRGTAGRKRKSGSILGRPVIEADGAVGPELGCGVNAQNAKGHHMHHC